MKLMYLFICLPFIFACEDKKSAESAAFAKRFMQKGQSSSKTAPKQEDRTESNSQTDQALINAVMEERKHVPDGASATAGQDTLRTGNAQLDEAIRQVPIQNAPSGQIPRATVNAVPQSNNADAYLQYRCRKTCLDYDRGQAQRDCLRDCASR